MENYIEDQTFDKNDYSRQALQEGKYYNCRFLDCNFFQAKVGYITFMECEFQGCDFNMVKIYDVGFRDVRFSDCKMVGLDFHACNHEYLSVKFQDCNLNFTSFTALKLKGTLFESCNLQEADFTDADLSESIFDNCDLYRAIFDNTGLVKADFHTAYHYSINPELNFIREAKFSLAGVPGLLDKYGIEIV